MTQTINRTQFRNAAIAACRVAYKATHGGDFDTDCPIREKWIREEEDALEPALEALGINVEPRPVKLTGIDYEEALRRFDRTIAAAKTLEKAARIR